MPVVTSSGNRMQSSSVQGRQNSDWEGRAVKELRAM